MASSAELTNGGYTSRRMRHLPHDFRFDDDVTLTVDYARETDVTSCFRALLSDSAARGDNVGVDEVDTPYDTFSLEYAEVFVARRSSSSSTESQVVAFIIINQSPFSRSLDPCLASIHVIRSRDISDVTYTGLVRLSVELTELLDLGYTDCVMSLAASCHQLLNVLRHQGFLVVVALPHSINMVDIGLTDTLVLVKNFDINIRQPREFSEVLEMLSRHGLGEEQSVHSSNVSQFDVSSLHQLSFLPQQYTFQSGLQVTLRALKPGEDRQAFQLFHSSAERGEGLSAYDVPTLPYFRRYMLEAGPCVVLEELSSGTMVGWIAACPSWFTRTPTGIYAEPTGILAKSFQSRGIGKEFMLMINGLAKELGYRGLIGDYFAHNTRLRRLSPVYAPTLGVIPRGAYVKGEGWTNDVITYMDLTADHILTLSQLAAFNKHKSTNCLAKL